MNLEKTKNKVADYWNKASCGTEFINEEKYSKEYFEAIEEFRYTIEPEIFSFAQFTRFRGKKILEVGVGAGTDFLQFVRAGAEVYGIDLTQESIENTQKRLNLYSLSAKDLRVADAENLPYEDDSFDLVYSWGVIHHSPNPIRCLEEIIRVTKPQGSIKIMIYHRRSLFAWYQYILHGFLKGKPFQSVSTILKKHQESYGTKAYTKKEMIQILKKYPVNIKSLETHITSHDLLYYKSCWVRYLIKYCALLLGWHSVGWFMLLDLRKK